MAIFLHTVSDYTNMIMQINCEHNIHVFLHTRQEFPGHRPVQDNVVLVTFTWDVRRLSCITSGCLLDISFDVSSAKCFNVNVIDRGRTVHFLAANIDILALN